jgi:hypothetical protein
MEMTLAWLIEIAGFYVVLVRDMDMYTDVRGSAFSVGIVEFVISPQPSVDSGRGSAVMLVL